MGGGHAATIHLACAAALLLGGCASTRTPDSTTNPLDRPAADIGLIQSVAPEILQRARAAPYAPLERCARIRAELAALDEALGPDVDAPRDEASGSDTAAAIASDVIGGFIPYRGIVRRLTGAADRQAELERAVEAGVARRGFLKGLARARRCPAPPAPRPAPPATP